MSTLRRLTSADLQYVAATLLPEEDSARAAVRLRHDEETLDSLLDDERLFRRISGDREAMLRISPWLLFGVLLRRVRRDLAAAPYTVERAQGERVAVFDAPRAGGLLADREILDYLVLMLTSFTRTDSWSLEVEQGGRIERRRFSDLNSDDMIALASLMPAALRFPILRRIADLALFMTGIFPEGSDPWYRQPGSPAAPRRGTRRTLEEYEEEGRRFYRLAARHEVARRTGLDRALEALADTFPLARKPLNVLASQYIHTSRMLLFGEIS